jgi:2,3-bisphosphoglycerate-independent phosphoglycerate mutase
VVHVITDGRDTPPQSGIGFVRRLEAYLEEHPGVIASVSGRYYTMDRDKRWPRTQMGYRVITDHAGHEGATAPSASAALEASYANDVTDEFVLPVAIDAGDSDVQVAPGDCVLFYNFRADRMRQLVQAFAYADFDGFDREFIPICIW